MGNSFLISSCHITQDNGQYRGVRLVSGQDLFSPRLVLDPSFVVQLQSGSSLQQIRHKNVEAKVARGICITRASLMPDISNLVVVYPPRCKLSHYSAFVPHQYRENKV